MAQYSLTNLSTARSWPRHGTLSVDRWIARRIRQSIEGSGVGIELWDGWPAPGSLAGGIGALVVRDRRALLGLALNPELYFGESYMSGRLDVRGPLDRVLCGLSRSQPPAPRWRDRLSAMLARPISLTAAEQNVHTHYDLGNDFYALWLDPELVYTCGYFPHRDATLEQAQEAKLDLICRKLQLRAGDRVVDAGCGWGALALHMARRYGARVRAFNISQEQLSFARERARREDLAGRVEFIHDDYRNISDQCDAFVSIGMLEHVGLHQLHSLGEVIRRVLRRDGGRGLLHFIGRDAPRPLNLWIRRRIFPGAYPPTLAQVTTRVLEAANMSVVDVENLRLHYARTLACWSERFAAARAEVSSRYGEPFARAWELYLAGSGAAFATGWMQLFQVVFAPRESAPPSWTRPLPLPLRKDA
jgi:cyclopropane-fatty-acyl-phospholipid synthase